MSILIKGMEMPQGNSTINVLIYADGTVYTGHVNDSRCSAVSVPTPHGDLVDRKYLISEYDRQHKGPAGGARRIIEDTPTIIEAEGSET